MGEHFPCFFVLEGIFCRGLFSSGCIFRGGGDIRQPPKKNKKKNKKKADIIFRCIKRGMLNADKSQKRTETSNKKKELELIK
jgi:hypothetical protein